MNEIEGWFQTYANVDGVGRDGSETTNNYAEPLADPTELVIVASRRNSGTQIAETDAIHNALIQTKWHMTNILDAYTRHLDGPCAPVLKEAFLRRYTIGDRIKDKHIDSYSLAVLRYWGEFTGGKLEYVLHGSTKQLSVYDGDLVIMAGSQLRHGCGPLTGGSRYVFVQFYDMEPRHKRKWACHRDTKG